MTMKPTTNSRAAMLWELSQGYRLLFTVAAVTSILSITANYLMPQVIRFIVDVVLGQQPFPAFLAGWLTALGGREFLRRNLLLCAVAAMSFSVLSGLFSYACRVSAAKASEGMMRTLRDKLYAHIQQLPYHWQVETPTGDTIQRCTADVEVVRNFVSNQLLEVLRTVFLVALSLGLMFSMNVKLSLIACVFIVVVMAYSGYFYAKIATRFLAADEAEGALSAGVQENLTGVRVVRAFGRQAHEIQRFDQKNNRFAQLWIKLGYLMSYYWGIGDLFSGLQVLCMVCLGVAETINGNITLGEYILFIVYNSMLVWPVRALGRILSEMSKTGVSLTRIQEILNAQEETDGPEATDCDLTGDIVFENVTFGYGAGQPVLHGVSFTLPAGGTLGILGGTGSGKSTLMYLLDRLYDLPADGSQGRITIGGVELRNIRRECLRRQIGFVLQEPFLFSKTVGENIGISQSRPALANIRHAAEIAAVDEAITQFEKGYDTVVGERGVTLSGGQKQRVAIARMLLAQPPIMAFDDSLSAVDAETDQKIRAALGQSTGKSTVILISHRITTLMQADQILVLEKGRVVQQGSHRQLVEQEGVYRRIYQMQGALENELEEVTEDA